MSLYKTLIRPILFRFDPELIHDFTIKILGRVSCSRLLLSVIRRVLRTPELPVERFGLRFPNPVGLAAGMDKDASALPVWRALGFGFIELGAITWHPQPGNPQPRLFRIVEREAIINRMGFNNIGAQAFAERLQDWKNRGLWPDCPVGVNVGKSRRTPLTEAADDYHRTVRLLAPLVDFFVINVSSPNTPGLRQLQEKASLREILSAVQEAIQQHRPADPQPDVHREARPKPLLIKIAPELSESALADVVEVALETGVAGLVATNTTTMRPDETDPRISKLYRESGGLSGRPLAARSNEVIRIVHRLAGDRLPIIGVGGILGLEDAIEKLQAGACLLQLYTGLVYEGPFLIKKIVTGLGRLMQSAGCATFDELCSYLRHERPSV